jgi:hypothetical protein
MLCFMAASTNVCQFKAREMQNFVELLNLTLQLRRPPWKDWLHILHPVRRHLILVVRCHDKSFQHFICYVSSLMWEP